MERLHVKPRVIPYLWPLRSANQLQPHMHTYSTWAWSHKVLQAHLPLPLWSKYKYMCTVSEDRKKPRIFSYEGWDRIENERMAGEIVKQQFSQLSKLCFAMTRRVFLQKLPAPHLRWQLLPGWALNNSLPLSSSHVSDHLIYFLYIYNNIVVSVDCLRPVAHLQKTKKQPFSLTNTSPALCFCCSLSIEGFVFGSPHISQNKQSRQQMSGPEDKSSRLGTINDVTFAQRCLWSFHRISNTELIGKKDFT